jgi:hypothetical protein
MMKFFTGVSALAAFLVAATTGVQAAPPAKGALEPDKVGQAAATVIDEQPSYITDVQGKRVRLVGPRFLTNPKRAYDFPGRDELRFRESDQ